MLLHDYLLACEISTVRNVTLFKELTGQQCQAYGYHDNCSKMVSVFSGIDSAGDKVESYSPHLKQIKSYN